MGRKVVFAAQRMLQADGSRGVYAIQNGTLLTDEKLRQSR